MIQPQPDQTLLIQRYLNFFPLKNLPFLIFKRYFINKKAKFKNGNKGIVAQNIRSQRIGLVAIPYSSGNFSNIKPEEIFKPKYEDVSQSLIHQGISLTKVGLKSGRGYVFEVAIPYSSGNFSNNTMPDYLFSDYLSQSLIHQGISLTQNFFRCMKVKTKKTSQSLIHQGISLTHQILNLFFSEFYFKSQSLIHQVISLTESPFVKGKIKGGNVAIPYSSGNFSNLEIC